MDADRVAPMSDTEPGDELAALTEAAIDLARRWLADTATGQTAAERATGSQLAALVADQAGLDLAVRFVDRVARPEDPGVAARELSRLRSKDAAGFLPALDLALLGVGAGVARLAPALVLPLARARLRHIVGHLVVDAEDPALARHLAAARRDGYRLNVNLLGEAVLGEAEAASRTHRTGQLLARPDVDYVSIKVSSLVSQINVWDTEGTIERCLDRLRPLYRIAMTKSPPAFVNLDMEEYKDLDLTLRLFRRLLSEPEFHQLVAGVVLQAYLPDALPALEQLIDFAAQRRRDGGAAIKVRLVKGANLAMEHVDAAIHGWTSAPYDTKAEVDANYLLCLERCLRPGVADESGGLRVGVASHNLFHVALAHLLARSRGVSAGLDIEMLQGMAPAQARAVRAEVGSVLLYTPVVAPKDFDVAVSYLIRRLEENAAKENFLHAAFTAAGDAAPQPGAAPVAGATPLDEQEARFRAAVADRSRVSVGPRRSPGRAPIGPQFANTPDSDPALPETRVWALAALAAQPEPLTSPVIETVQDVGDVIARAREAGRDWSARPPHARAEVLREAARALEQRRGRLLGVMAREGGKTVAEADPEISEAIDFARYYAQRALDLAPGRGLASDGARFEPAGVVLVTPPWNFPVAIPIGGVLAALAAGCAVVIKPAHLTPGCVEVAVGALHEAGVPPAALQVVRAGTREVGRALVEHRDVEVVILTGSSETATMFASWRASRPGGPGIYAETSGKNALVITPSADLDLAVADLVRSAFGHAGQKCSAASLAILVGSVARSQRFRRQLIDAVSSLRVGWPHDPAAVMGPIIEPPEGKLLRALTTLEPGESWLVQPHQLDDSGRLWSPGLKDGVAPGSFFHLSEVFGPVLGLMSARTLAEAITLQNATDFGLTGGLHSLDETEIGQWTDSVEVGNAYLNRHITGAIVQRQPFGGWKGSVVGPGAKAGGPNYVAQLGRWLPDQLPTQLAEPGAAVRQRMRELIPLVAHRQDRLWLRTAAGSDAHAWAQDLGLPQDVSDLRVEANVFRYRPMPGVWVRTTPGCRVVEVLRLILAATLTGAGLRISLDRQTSAYLKGLRGRDGEVDPECLAALRVLASWVEVAEDDESFVARVGRGEVSGRIRLVGPDDTRAGILDASGVAVVRGPVLATGRRELLVFLREQAISWTRHRFGHVAAAAMAPLPLPRSRPRW